MADTIRLWELGLMQDEGKVRMERLGDVSPNGAVSYTHLTLPTKA